MKYEIRSSIATSLVALLQVADAMASAEAVLLTDSSTGESVFHTATYEGRFNDYVDALLAEARTGGLRVCDYRGCQGPLESIIAEAKQAGQLVQVMRYVVEPDWARLKQDPTTEVAPGVHSFTHLNLGPSVPDPDYDGHMFAAVVYTTPKWLAEWHGDEFVVVQTPVAAVCAQGFIGTGMRGARPRKARSSKALGEPLTGETSAERCKRLLDWFDEETAKQKYGALARVTRRDGRTRQTVKADVDKARAAHAAESGPFAMMAKAISKR